MTIPRRWIAIWLWTGVLAAVTILLRAVRSDTDQAHVVLAYLLVVLGGSASGGRGLGVGLACTGFFLIDFFFQVPYDRFTVAKPVDWAILISFLVTSFVATQLLTAAQEQAAEADRRAAQVASLSAERARLLVEAEHAKALREADRMKDALLASVSHDLRTPLTTIKALAQDGALRGDENSSVIEEQADRLSRFVADLLDLSRLKGSAFPVVPELNTAEDLLGAAVRQVTGLLNGRTLRPQVDLSQPALVGRFDFVQSLRILSNVIENALRYSPPDVPIDLTVEREDSMLVFTIADRGPGVAPEDRDRIFEPFYRRANAPPDTGRAGLGLSIARRLAEVQDGTLTFEPREGGGSVFALRLPAADLLVES